MVYNLPLDLDKPDHISSCQPIIQNIYSEEVMFIQK